MKVNVSIHDFSPLLRGYDFVFKNLKETGVDGIELVLGVKSRWSISYFKNLSKKYSVPIVSLHQPAWSGLGLYFDEGFFSIAKELKVTHITCHPLPGASFQSNRMRAYLKKLSQVKKRTGLEVLIENMPTTYNVPIIENIFPLDASTGDVMSLYTAISEFGLNMTLDIDHLQSPSPQKEPYFKTIYPKIKNIHVSSFDSKRHHLPLHLGNFHATEFIHYLKKEEYKGLVTLEIDYPGLITWFGYNFEAVKKSVEIVKG
jgi:sugar phosphate isomerase/epimerase